MSPLRDVERLVILAPNWLGDVVMAMPAIADVRRALPRSQIVVAARPGVAGVLPFVPGLDGTLVLDAGRGLTAGGFDAALLLPNSFRAAWLAWRARIRERWGYRGECRAPLLTRAIRRPAWPYRQVEYYQRLTAALGFATGAEVPMFLVPGSITDAARELLQARGCDHGDRVVVLAPGTAASRSKQWIPEYVSALIALLSRDGVRCVLVGARGDAAVGGAILSALPEPVRERVIDLVGQTSMEQLVGILAFADVVVGNDSGSTHLAAGLGTKVVATFGPTNEKHSWPLAHPESPAVVVTHDVWCRPCMLMKDCPIDHSCMTGITPDRIFKEVRSLL